MNKLIVSISWVLAALFAGCESEQQGKPALEFKDDLGRVVRLEKQPVKTMALASSITEMLSLICADSQLVGRTQNCDYPHFILSKPVVNNYPIDFEKLLLLKPDIVFVKEGIISLEDASKIQDMGIPVYFQRYKNIADIFKGMRDLGKIMQREDRAESVADSLEKALATVKTKGAAKDRPSVLLVITLDRIYVFGKDSYASDMLEAAGGVNAVDQVFTTPFPQITSEYILKINPDILILEEGIKGDLLEHYPELKNINAVKNKRIHYIPGDKVSRPGPRVVSTIELLHELIYTNGK